jgi:NF-X1-type zinc finger protein NFXL1
MFRVKVGVRVRARVKVRVRVEVRVRVRLGLGLGLGVRLGLGLLYPQSHQLGHLVQTTAHSTPPKYNRSTLHTSYSKT